MVKFKEHIEVSKSFKGRAVLSGELEGEALVSHVGFNAYASFYNGLKENSRCVLCADSGNSELFGKRLDGKVLCIPKTTGSTSAGAVWQRIGRLGVAPAAILFSQVIDPLAAGGLIIADLWAGRRIVTIDQLGDEFLQTVQSGDQLSILKDGWVIIN
jgi:predicted aconitase with swiveling domain